jgi:hypothetical protein
MEESQELVPDAVSADGNTVLDNLPTSLSLVKKKRRSYGTAVVGLDESPQKDEQEKQEASNPLHDRDDDSIATEAKSLSGTKDLFDMEDEFFHEDEFMHDENLDVDQSSDVIADGSDMDQEEDIVEDYTQGNGPDDEIEHKDSDNNDAHKSDGVEADGDQFQNQNDYHLHDDQDVSSESPPIQSSTEESVQKPEVTDQDILDTVDTLFSEVDITTVTVKDIVRSIEDLFQIKIKKPRKAIIKERLFYLINRNGDDESEEEQDEEEEETKDEPSDDEFEPDAEEDDDLPKSSSPRSHSRNSRTPKQRKPSHVKIHHDMMRKRQIAEAKVRAEELQDQSQKKLSEEDRKRAELIAKKFETDNEEIRIKRMEDRIGLLSKLEQKRLMILKEEEEDLDMVLVSLKQKKSLDPILLTKDSKVNDADIDSDDNESDDELDIIDDKKMLPMDIKQLDTQSPDPVRKASPKSVLAYFTLPGNTRMEKNAKRRQYANPRAALRNALKAKQFENGNLWLAK